MVGCHPPYREADYGRIFIGPTKDRLKKIEHEHCLLEVIDWYKNGTPRLLELIPIESVLEVGGEACKRRFITASIPKCYIDEKDSGGK